MTDTPSARSASIVERLRAHHETPSVIRSHPTICDEAAAEIERLRALSQNNAHSWDAIVRERDELRAEIERLRAIEDAAIEAVTYFHMGDGGEEDFDEQRMINLMAKLGRALEPKAMTARVAS